MRDTSFIAMTVHGILLGIELVALYALSRSVTKNLFVAFFLVTRSRPISISILSILFFPGTVIHELAHLFTAEILGVKTSGLTLVPEAIEEKNVRTGSVGIAQTDPIRRSIIGIAPVFTGLGSIGIIMYFLPQLSSYWIVGIGYWVLFVISNTMFSSPEDLEGFWPVVLVIALFATAGYIVGFRFSLTGDIVVVLETFLKTMAGSVGWVVGINIALLILSKLIVSAVERISKRKLTLK